MARLTGLAGNGPLPDPNDRSTWPSMKARLAALVRTRTRDDWSRLLQGSDACFAPVLEPGEAPEHPHNQERRTFVEVEGVVQAAPAPRFSRTVPGLPSRPARAGEHSEQALASWGFSSEEIVRLRESGAVDQR